MAWPPEAPCPSTATKAGCSVRDQIERYRTAFISVVTMIVIAAAVGGYILAHENLHLPELGAGARARLLHAEGRVPDRPGGHAGPGPGGDDRRREGRRNRERRPAQRASPMVTMKVTPKYARFYHERDAAAAPEDAAAGHHRRGQPGHARRRASSRAAKSLPLSQTAPNVNFDEFLAGLDAETRAYLQELLAGAGERLQEQRPRVRRRRSSASSPRRATPSEIAQQLEVRHENIARSIHNFRLLMEALGSKDKQIAQLVDASNAVFQTFAKEEREPPEHAAPAAGRAAQDGQSLGKVGAAPRPGRPDAARSCNPFAKALAPGAAKRPKSWRSKTTPIIKNEIRPFAREILPTVNELAPVHPGARRSVPEARRRASRCSTNSSTSSPTTRARARRGFLFFLDWANHNLNSVRQHRRRARARRAQPHLLQLRSPADPQRRRAKSTQRSTCSSAC